MDEVLDWDEHVQKLIHVLAAICYGIRVTSKYPQDKNSLSILYCANFEFVLKYGITFWGSNTLMGKVFVAQKRAIRVILKMGFRDSCRGKFRALSLLTAF